MSRLLVTNAAIVTMDDVVGDLPRGDILIDGSRIVAVGPKLDLSDETVEVFDASGCIVLPGLVSGAGGMFVLLDHL
jgi:5-methylthioadenosine/S-adenosylhomocysteine deaminase